jgi:hypothetical protein
MKRHSQKTHDIYDHGVDSDYVISIVMVTEANKVGYIRGVLIAPSTGVWLRRHSLQPLVLRDHLIDLPILHDYLEHSFSWLIL